MSHHLSTISRETEQCIEKCSTAHDICTESVAWCLQHGREHADPAHIKLLLDCAQICETSRDFMLRNSELSSQICAVCAEVCERCADSCEQLEGAQGTCAAACRGCAEACRQVAS